MRSKNPTQRTALASACNGRMSARLVLKKDDLCSGSPTQTSWPSWMFRNVRELEDLLISECFYPGLIKGKLDQRQSCLHVQEAVARDVRPQELQPIISGLANWWALLQPLKPNCTSFCPSSIIYSPLCNQQQIGAQTLVMWRQVASVHWRAVVLGRRDGVGAGGHRSS